MAWDLDTRIFWNFVAIYDDGCWLWTGDMLTSGYGRYRVGEYDCRSHRMAWEIMRGPIPDGLHVLHKCDVRNCVNPGHLFLGTNDDNIRDAIKKGRNARGEINGHAKLTEEQVRQIRADNRSLKNIGASYGIAFTTVAHIKKNRTWRHVT